MINTEISMRIKTVLLWGILILIVQQVLGYLLGKILGGSPSVIMIGMALSLVITAVIAYKSAKSLLEGFLEGVVVLLPVVALSGGLNYTAASYLGMLLIIVGSSLGGLLASKKK